ADYPLLGDARLVLRQFIEAVKSQGGRPAGRESVRAELERVRTAWLAEWAPTLGSAEVPMTPYRVIAEFMRVVDPRQAIITHDSGSPRDQLLPFYRSVSPRGYLGWGKSHALGTGLGLIIGAKLAAPDKFCVNFMGDAAFGMTGLDFETAVRCGIPITTIVLNNSAMAIERHALVISHDRYRTRDIGGNYADMGRAMGGQAERVAETAGFDGIWLTEHNFTGESVYCDPIPFASVVAARTSRIRIGFAVLQLALRHPIRLATELALLDNLSGGRLDIGVGHGTNFNE